MNEFIVWDKSDVKFWTLEELRETCELDILVSDDFSIKLINFGIEEIFNPDGGDYSQHFRREVDIETFNHIGLKDINNKNIYSDSSIVEFFDHKQDYFKGYFTFNIKKLAYEIIVFSLNEDFRDVITYCKDEISNIKIIDTIQENKLGLIK